MFTPGPARLTSRLWSRGWRRLRGFTGTGLAYPNARPVVAISNTGKMIVPKGSMWAIGLSVSRPARFAVSSPKLLATHPCDTSWRMIDGNSIAKKTMRSCVIGRPRAALALGCAVDAVAGGRLGLETGGQNRLATVLAGAVAAGFELGQGVLDLAQGLPQRLGQCLGLAPLRGDLTGVGKVLVVVQPAVLAQAELG